MKEPPDQAPLGATPTIPSPEPINVERLRRVAARVLGISLPGATPEEAYAADRCAPASRSLPGFGRGRRYDVALSLLGWQQRSEEPDTAGLHAAPQVTEAEEVAPPPESEPAQTAATPEPSSDLPPWDEVTQVYRRSAATGPEPMPERPPPGAPTVRPPVPRSAAERAAIVDNELLQATADSALLVADPDGSASFEIAFRDELFADLCCCVTVRDGRVLATFKVRDDNTRRLLQAEAGRLRVQLEQRGLRVADVEVVVEE